MLVQQIRLRTCIRCWLNTTHIGWKEKKIKINFYDQFFIFLSLIASRVRRWEKNIGYEILHAGEETQENKDLIKQYYCCSSPFSFGNLQFIARQPSAFTPNRMLPSDMIPPLKAFMFFPLVQWPVITVLKLWSNLYVKQNQSICSQKPLFYITESTGTITFQNREWKRKLYRNILYPMLTQTSLPVLVAALDWQKLINPSLFCEFFSEWLGKSGRFTSLVTIILNPLSKTALLIHHAYISFHNFSYSFMASNKAKNALTVFLFQKSYYAYL